MNPRSERRLAAILFTDIVGSTAVTARSEAEGMKLRDRHRELVRPMVERYHGRFIEAPGDESLSTFESVVDAVQCALAIQQIGDVDPDLQLHIGIHQSETVFRGNEVFGDGVNIAARICSLSDGNAPFISDEVKHAVQNQANLDFESLGEHDFKNVPRSVPVYRVTGVAEPPRHLSVLHRYGIRGPGQWLIAAWVMLAMIGVGFWSRHEAVVSGETSRAVQAVPEEREKSIAVLPFVNMSSDPEQEYFSDGLSEDILNLLARIPGLKVIGRTSSFAFKGRYEDLRVIGQSLGVRTVLEGSVRKSGNRVRITAQLIDVSDGAHIWSESYDRTMTDIFAVQDEVAAAIIDALQIHVGTNPTRGRPTENSEAYVLFLKGRASITANEWQDAEAFLLKAVELDPNFAEAYEILAFSYWFRSGWIMDSAEGRLLTADAAAKALAVDPDLVFAQALFATGTADWIFPLEIEAFERAVREEPGNSEARHALIWSLMVTGYHQEAVRVAERFVELDPLFPAAHFHLGDALYAVGRDAEATVATKEADQLGMDLANWGLGIRKLLDKQDDAAIAHFEAFLEQRDYPDSTWVRDLVTGARDPASGQAFLDRRLPDLFASIPEDDPINLRGDLIEWYLFFGFIDRYIELILDLNTTDVSWSDASVPVYQGTLYRRLGFTAHPKYLEVVQSMGIIDLWERRGPPDFCKKVDGQWVCE